MRRIARRAGRLGRLQRLQRLRRPLAGLLAAGAVWSGMLALREAPPAGVRMLVASRDLSGGTRLEGADLRLVRVPSAAVPSGAVRGRPVGRLLAGPMRAGEPFTDARLVGRRLLGSYGPGTVATPVRIADAGAVRLLHPGIRVDVLAMPGGTPLASEPPQGRLLVSSVPVVAIPKEENGDRGALVVLATGRGQATALAGAGAPLAVTITGW